MLREGLAHVLGDLDGVAAVGFVDVALLVLAGEVDVGGEDG